MGKRKEQTASEKIKSVLMDLWEMLPSRQKVRFPPSAVIHVKDGPRCH